MRDSTLPERRSAGGGGALLGPLMRPLNSMVEKLIPSALVFAIVLTFIVAILALLLTEAGPLDVVEEWGMGLAGLLEFMTQMALILFLGYILASTRPARALLRRLAQVPRSPMQAYLFVFVVAALASDTFLTQSNLTNLLRQIVINGLLSLGMLVVILSGGIDLSVGAVVALSAVLVGSFGESVPWPVAVVLAIGAASLVGLINGGIVARFGRFPHRNAVLGRPSTAEEHVFLEEDGAFRG